MARQCEDWTPDKAWTAWPMGWERVPPTGFMRGGDEDDDGDGKTFRRPRSREGFGAELEEEVSAMILRLSKEKFRSRGLEERDGDESEEVVPSVETAGEEESDVSLPRLKDESQSGVEDEGQEQAGVEAMDSDARSEARRKRHRAESPVLVPTVSADDDLSHELLRPVTRHLLTKLDKTLTVLHNARVAGIYHASESDEGQEETTKAAPNTPRREVWRGEDSPSSKKPTSRRTELYTHQGEKTERDMRLRLARKYPRRISRSSGEEGETTAAENVTSRTRRGPKRTRVRTRSMSRASHGQPDADVHRGKRLDDWALRDWSDVLGAAALAGFSPGVIAKATQRCADLFGQGMVFNTLVEEPARGAARKSRTTRYVPGEPALPASDEEDEEEGYRSEAEQIRAVSRASSVIMDASSDEHDSADTQQRSRDRSRSRSRSRRGYSVAPSVVRFFCPYPTCSGAISGFARRYNLKKHLISVHGKTPESLSEDEEDMDEVHGAVHVDGFLKPIRARKGWRAGDTRPSIGRRQRRKTRAGTPPPTQFFSDDGYHAEFDDDDLTKQEDDQDYT